MAIRYTERGKRSAAAAFIGEMGLFTSLAQVLVADQLIVEVAVLPPVSAGEAANRHGVARAARAAIARKLGLESESLQRDQLHSSADCDSGQSR